MNWGTRGQAQAPGNANSGWSAPVNGQVPGTTIPSWVPPGQGQAPVNGNPGVDGSWRRASHWEFRHVER